MSGDRRRFAEIQNILPAKPDNARVVDVMFYLNSNRKMNLMAENYPFRLVRSHKSDGGNSYYRCVRNECAISLILQADGRGE